MIEAFGAVAAILNSVVGIINLIILLAGIISLKNGISIIHSQSNSNQDKLINEVRTASLAKGALDEQNREKR